MTAGEHLGIDGVDDVTPLDVEGSAIYRARQRRHNRPVAIKVLDPHLEPIVPRRFELRRKPIHRFAENSGVVPVYDAGTTADGDPYLMMPYFRIGSLADQLAHGPTPWHTAAELVMRAAEIVGRAHEDGIVIGDLKPASLLLADTTSPLVAVYGMATRRFDNGTPSYAAPETDRIRQPSLPGDVFSLGLSLAALIAGQAPRPSATSFPVDDVRSLAPARVVEVIDRALSPDPGSRQPDASALAAELRSAIGGDDIAPLPTVIDLDLDELLGGDPVDPAWPPPSLDRRGEPSAGTLAAFAPPAVPPSSPPSSPMPSPALAPTAGTSHPPPPREVDLFALDEPVPDGAGPTPPAPPAPTPPLVPASGWSPDRAGSGSMLADEELPFRALDPQPHRVPDPTPARRFLDPLQTAWHSFLRSLVGIAAFVGLAVIALVVGAGVVQGFGSPPETETDPVVATTQPDDAVTTFAPTSQPPQFVDPPVTNSTSTTRPIVRSTAPSPAAPSTDAVTTVAPAPTGSPATTTTSPPATATTSARSPATGTSSTVAPATGAPTTSPRSTGPPPGAPDDDAAADAPEGPTEPLVQSLAVARVRPTSAQVRFSSAACVTATFTVSGPDAAPYTVSGGDRCSTSYTLLVGTVTPSLAPATTYTVVVTATDADGRSTTRDISFRTLG